MLVLIKHWVHESRKKLEALSDQCLDERFTELKHLVMDNVVSINSAKDKEPRDEDTRMTPAQAMLESGSLSHVVISQGVPLQTFEPSPSACAHKLNRLDVETQIQEDLSQRLAASGTPSFVSCAGRSVGLCSQNIGSEEPCSFMGRPIRASMRGIPSTGSQMSEKMSPQSAMMLRGHGNSTYTETNRLPRHSVQHKEPRAVTQPPVDDLSVQAAVEYV